MKNFHQNEPTLNPARRPYQDSTAEILNYIALTANNRSYLRAKGLPFVFEIIHKLVDAERLKRAELEKALRKPLQSFEPRFIAGLLDLIIGDNPEVHSFRVDAEGYISERLPH